MDTVTIFLYCTFIIICHYDKITAFQFSCTFHNAIHLTSFCLWTAQIIAHLHKSFNLRSFSEHKIHFLIIAGMIIEH